MTEQVVATEVAEAEFERFCEAMDLDIDPAGLDEQERKTLADIRRVLVSRICDGALVINENGEPEYSPKSGGAVIVFHEPKGSTLMAMDTKKKNQDMARSNAVLAAMTKQPEKRFVDMPMRDLKVCQKIMTLFFG